MIAVVGGIQTGKTTRMMEYAKEHDCIVLTFSRMRAHQLRDYFDYKDVYAFYEYEKVKGLYGRFVIDDLELCLPGLLGRPVDMVTMKAQLMPLKTPEIEMMERRIMGKWCDEEVKDETGL